jgi:2-hydroxychromene-2-carboxylate isomerase
VQIRAPPSPAVSDATVTLYVDYRSPYSYLAKEDAYRLEDDFRVNVDWYPYGIDIEGVYGGVEQRTEREWRKVRYLYMDVRRLANARGLIVRGTRRIYDPTLASLGMLYAKSLGVLRQYHDFLLSKFWIHQAEIDRGEDIEAALVAAGAKAEGFRVFVGGEGPAQLRRVHEAADAQGVFGVPTFIFRGELFWGMDRIELLRERLAAARLGRTTSI